MEQSKTSKDTKEPSSQRPARLPAKRPKKIEDEQKNDIEDEQKNGIEDEQKNDIEDEQKNDIEDEQKNDIEDEQKNDIEGSDGGEIQNLESPINVVKIRLQRAQELLRLAEQDAEIEQLVDMPSVRKRIRRLTNELNTKY
jgi:hypothetical protein